MQRKRDDTTLLELGLALLFARGIGYLFDRYKQPVVIGEILAGVVLGGFVLGRFSGQNITLGDSVFTLPALNLTSSEFTVFASIGILFLLFLSGLETKIETIKKIGTTSILVAVLGVIVPLIFGYLVGLSFGFLFHLSLIVGVILVATSVGITVRVLMDLHLLDSDIGAAIIGSAVIDDVIGILLLAFILGIHSPILFGIEIIVFFLVFLFIGLKIIGKVTAIGEKIHIPKALLSIAIAVLMIYAFFAEQLGVAAITGAFIAGLLIGNTIQSRKILEDVRTIGYGFFIPLFFVWIGASMDLTAFLVIGPLAVIVILGGVVTKILGCGLGAKLSGMNSRNSLLIGIGMVPRMEVALIVVTTAIAYNILNAEVGHQLLAVTLLLTIVTTIITPFLIKHTVGLD
ncbi:MAG: cation:proton antiporter [Thermoplasmatales archaeon]|nr:MAG: cation:proton antiporter [Thermoplasmatales archaeon]